jgi:peroxiredoxin
VKGSCAKKTIASSFYKNVAYLEVVTRMVYSSRTHKSTFMKQAFLLSLLFGCGGSLFAGNVRLNGNISHQLADSVQVSYCPPTAKYEPLVYKAKLVNGHFELALQLPEGYTELTFSNGREETQIVVQPGSDLTVTIDAARFDSTVHYEGTGKEIANFMARTILEHHDIRSVDLKAQMLATKGLAEYRAGLKELLEAEAAYVDKNSAGLPETFVAYVKKAEQYEVYYTMHMYPYKAELYKKKGNDIKETPEESYEVIFDIPAEFADQYLTMQSYRAYLNNYMGMRVKAEDMRAHRQIEAQAWADSMYARSYRELPPQSAEYITGRGIYYSMQGLPVGLIEKRYEEYRTHFPKSKNLPTLEDAISRMKKIAPGKSAIDFDITTPEGEHMKLSDLKGKVVYIDFWSRSCAPCVAEMPKARKIREHFKDKPVAFVYVSLDDEVTWKEAINKFKVEGINTHLEKGRESELVTQYEAAAIPCYYLIDKNGKYADVKTVARPSDTENLIAQIEALLR